MSIILTGELQGNPTEAVKFLIILRPKGPWTLGAIPPEGGVPETVTFTDPKDARKWIASRDGKVNLYYSLNPMHSLMTTKPSEGDVKSFVGAHVDCDPKPDETATEAQKRIRAALKAYPTPPTIIYTSGNGVVGVWMLNEPMPVEDAADIARCKGVNIALRDALAGDKCQSLDHLLRLPYTVNLPNAKKRAAGRVAVVSGNVEHFPARTYAFDELPYGGAVHIAEGEAPSIGAPEAADVEDLLVSDGIKELIRNGTDGDRSEAVYRVVCAMHNARVSPEEMLGILTDERYSIGERFRERGNCAEEAARKDIARVIRKHMADLAQDFAEALETDHLPDDPPEPIEAAKKLITPTPYVWTDPTKIKPREWVYRPFYIRKFAGSTVATGGAGKSSLLLVETVGMASGKNLLGVDPESGLKVWYWNGEDPQDELQRRVQAILKHYKVTAADIEGRLFVDSGRDTVIRIAGLNDRGQTKIAVPVVNRMIEVIRDLEIDVVIIDPFVSSHGIPENDNNAIDRVAKKWADIADKTNTHVHISHHTRKTNGMGVTAEDSRGASSLHNAMRTRRAISTMTASEAEKAGIVGNARLSYFKADTAGSSMTKPAESMEWYKFESVSLANGKEFGASDGDEVGVVVKWDYKMPGLEDLPGDDANVALAALEMGGPWRASDRADRWAGEAVAKALHLDHTDQADRKRIKEYLKGWIAKRWLEVYDGKDEHRNKVQYLKPMDFG